MSGGADALTIHAGAALVDGVGVLVRGASGSGKSSLLLALIMADRTNNRLVADDRVALEALGDGVLASPPRNLAGLIEIRGQGIMRLPHVAPQRIGLVVDLEPEARCPRMPAVEDRQTMLQQCVLPRLLLPIGQADGWIRVRAALMTRAYAGHEA